MRVHHAQVDDGTHSWRLVQTILSEGYSASVANMLAAHWNEIGDLAVLASKRPDFERFAIRHIDETMTMDQGNAIKLNARKNCPAKASRICASIQTRFTELGNSPE